MLASYNKLQQKLGEFKSLKQQLVDKNTNLADLDDDLDKLEKAILVVNDVGALTQDELTFRISDIVTEALQSVFGDEYFFKIYFEIKRGKTEAVIKLEKDGNELDLLTGSGGGVCDIVSYALRLACFLITIPQPDKVLLLDEPALGISARYRGLFADFIEAMSDKLGFQFIMVTHSEEYQIGSIIKI